MLVISLPAFILSGIILSRMVLILAGLHKGPILNLFEKYGDGEHHFQPVLVFLLWGGVLLWAGSDVGSRLINIPSIVGSIGIILLVLAYIFAQLPVHVRFAANSSLRAPTWYHRLYTYTGREERRQIAYMWLRLPLRTRLIFNSNDRAFFQWADLIIMASVS